MTPEGFNKKRLDDLITALEGHFKTVYGATFKVGPETKQGQIIANIAAELASLWDAAQGSYDAFNPSAALDKALSDLVQYNNLTRQPATPSQVVLTCTGTPGTTIPLGSIVEVENNDPNITGERFVTTATLAIGGGGTVEIPADSINTGPIVAGAGTLTKIFTPVTGWDSVTNADDAILGLEQESDEELRARRNRSTSINAQNIVDAAAAQLEALDDVVSVLVLENDTDIDPDSNGVPAHSCEAIVQGGDDQEIAQVLLFNKVPGIPWVGNTPLPTEDSQGITRNLAVTRPDVKEVEVLVALQVTSDYPGDGDDQIKQNIVDYASGELIPGRGFSVGDDVVISELYTPINLVPGHTVLSLQIAFAGDPLGTVNLPVSIRELSNFDIANITVNS